MAAIKKLFEQLIEGCQTARLDFVGCFVGGEMLGGEMLGGELLGGEMLEVRAKI